MYQIVCLKCPDLSVYLFYFTVYARKCQRVITKSQNAEALKESWQSDNVSNPENPDSDD